MNSCLINKSWVHDLSLSNIVIRKVVLNVNFRCSMFTSFRRSRVSLPLTLSNLHFAFYPDIVTEVQSLAGPSAQGK
jgi:hypothetical protein